MCGIAGIIKLNQGEVSESDLVKMGDMLAHRGPDGSGTWLSDNKKVGFSHRRLSIIDLNERSAQPMHYKNFTITYNGEIYNYLELKTELQKIGHVFLNDSDTEVLLVAFAEFGEDVFSHLDGMFAFAIFNQDTGETIIARDRFGEKPLYYSIENQEFVFASEIKSIADYQRNLKINQSALYRYLIYDLVENPDDLSQTFYQGISKLPPASIQRIQANGKIEEKKYWNPNRTETINISENEAIAHFRTLFTKSVSRRLRSDVLVGTSLSGGLDSSSVLATICNEGISEMNSFTARFDDPLLDEGEFVKELNKHFNFKINDTWPNEHQLAEDLDRLFYHQEEPFGSSSVFAQWEVMKLAKEKQVTVLIDGQGADETLGGYFKYFPVALHNAFLKRPFKFNKTLKELEETTGYRPSKQELAQILSPKTFDIARGSGLMAGSKKKLEIGLSKSLGSQAHQAPNPFKSFSKLNDALWYETNYYGLGKLLRFADRNSMAFSREVRLPYLSHELVEFEFQLPDDLKIKLPWTKYILRKAMDNYLPSEITWRKDKKGFHPPQNSWLSSDSMKKIYKEACEIVMNSSLISDPSVFHPWQVIMSAQLIRFTQRF